MNTLLSMWMIFLFACKILKHFVISSKKNTNSSQKELAHSVTILDADTPEMKMEPLLQIQGSMLTKSLSHMKKMFGEQLNQRRLGHHW